MRIAACTAAVALTASSLLGACATTPMPGGMAQDGNDCAVIAAIAKEHYRFGPENPPPPLKAGEDGWRPTCDWARYGLAFQPFDPNAQGDPRQTVRWVSFDRPKYDGRGATVATGILHGPLAGMGYECRVISGFAGWTVPEGGCRNTWVS